MHVGQFKFHNIFPILLFLLFSWLMMIGQPGSQRLPSPCLESNLNSAGLATDGLWRPHVEFNLVIVWINNPDLLWVSSLTGVP